MKVCIIGGGPIGCLAAIEFANRGIEVSVFEKSPDKRQNQETGGRSFNLTLSHRGFLNLPPDLVRVLYTLGVPMPQRVIHQADASVLYQPYGLRPDHHILSIPRKEVSKAFLNHAEKQGVQIHFGCDCLWVNPNTGSAIIKNAKGNTIDVEADLILGCDGANSVIRHEISRASSGKMYVKQNPATHAYVELNMPCTADGKFVLIEELKKKGGSQAAVHGLHVWPRNNFILLSQPNIDKTYTATLFMPLEAKDNGHPSFANLKTTDSVELLFEKYFPDAKAHIPNLTTDFFMNTPSHLRTIQCAPYHYGKAVLLGDAAHTMVPFYGQGINCGFEDVGQFFKILDTQRTNNSSKYQLRPVLTEYSAARTENCFTIHDLSQQNLEELSKNIADNNVLKRRKLENEIQDRYPDMFLRLYYAVAFTEIPYKKAYDKYKEQSKILDVICELYDIDSQKEEIIQAYLNRRTTPNHEEINIPLTEAKQMILDTVDYLFAYFEGLRQGNYPASYVHNSDDTTKYKKGIEAAEALQEFTPPKHGNTFQSILDTIFENVITNGTVHTHPGFMAHVPSGGMFQSAVGEFITRALNRFVSVWIASPGLTQIETNVIHWFCKIIGYTDAAFGYLTTSGSLSNFMGILCAKESHGGNTEIARYRIYTSAQSHFCVKKAAKLAGLSTDQIRQVHVDQNLKMRIDHLIDLIEMDKSKGFIPMCVIATAGTTNTGSVDSLRLISDICQENKIWFHVDACLGGFFTLTTRGKKLLDGLELADSIAVDAHKSLFLPHGTAAILVKEKQKLKDTFAISKSSYMPGFSQQQEFVDFCNYGPELSRETRGLSAWIPIKMHGLLGFEKALDKKLDLAIQLAKELKQLPEIELYTFNTCLPIVIFKIKREDRNSEDQANRRLCEAVCAQGHVYITTTALPKIGLVNRVCILHSKTNIAVIEQCIRDIKIAIQSLAPNPMLV